MKKIYFLSILLIILLAGCSVSEEEAIDRTVAKAKEAFQTESIASNQEENGISYFLPNGFNQDIQDKNNIIFTEGKQAYILFINPLEGPSSRVVYDTISTQGDNQVISKTFIDENQFGYTVGRELDKNMYELSVGIGGVKLTTKTNAKNMEKDALKMIEIVKSVKYNK